MNWLLNHKAEVLSLIAAAGGLKAILTGIAHSYRAAVDEGGVVNIVKAFMFGSARKGGADDTTTVTKTPTTPAP